MRKDVLRRNKDAKIIGRTYFCTKAGRSYAKSENSLIIHTECKAFARIKNLNGSWELSEFFC